MESDHPWKNVGDRFVVERMEVLPLEDPRRSYDPNLPRVLVIGDFISINYHDAAKQALAGIANYHRNEGDSMSSAHGVVNTELWLGDYQQPGGQWDVIQFNHGLHDLKQTYDAKTDSFGAYAVSIEDYKKNLEKQIAVLRKTGAQLIWCSTTPIPNDNKGQYARRKGANQEFNAAALEVMKKHPDILVNDLAHVVETSPVFDHWRTTNEVSFYEKEEQRVLGEAVAASVRKTLDSKKTSSRERITLPIRFHIMTGAVMTVKGQAMEMWVKPADLSGSVLQEVNRIWSPANIQFTVERAELEPMVQPINFKELCDSIAQFKRGDEVKLGNQRVGNISRLLDPAMASPKALNIYVLPYIGQTYQGYASKGSNHAVIGVWTDKYSNGKKPPVKTLLVEAEPMKVGSLARTIAHEIGHNLTLKHPDKSVVSPVGRLMGGRNKGYALTEKEIAKSRSRAKAHQQQFSL